MKEKKSPEDQEKYKDLCRNIKKGTRQDKRKWIDDRCSEVEKCMGTAKTKKAYRIVKDLKVQPRTNIKAINDKNGKLLTEEDEITQRWTEYVKELFTQQKTYDVEVVSELQRRTGRCDDSSDGDILLGEVQSTIKKLKND
jgi:Glu-tRNA(Gln) amidotransferase subunit E-like FAD-binding protein